DRAPIALLALQHGSAEHAEFLVEPAVDDIDRHASRADAIERDRELAHHDRIPQARVDGDQRANAVEARPDGAREYPGGDVVAQVPLGEQHKIKAGTIRCNEQVYAKLELGIDTSVWKRREGFGDGLRDLRRTDGRHRDRRVESKLHVDDLADPY